MPEMPTRIKVGPFVYSVRQDEAAIRQHELEHGNGVRGYTDHQRLVIQVDPHLAPGMQRQTIWHEIKHAVVEMFHGSDDEGKEEQWIGRMAPMELAVLRDNPDLVAYLTVADEPSALLTVGERATNGVAA